MFNKYRLKDKHYYFVCCPGRILIHQSRIWSVFSICITYFHALWNTAAVSAGDVPAIKIYRNWFKAPVKFSDHVGLLFILSGSLCYEVFEWGLTFVFAPDQAMLDAIVMILIRTARGMLKQYGMQKDTTPAMWWSGTG